MKFMLIDTEVMVQLILSSTIFMKEVPIPDFHETTKEDFIQDDLYIIIDFQ